jgi:hypothetical protein
VEVTDAQEAIVRVLIRLSLSVHITTLIAPCEPCHALPTFNMVLATTSPPAGKVADGGIDDGGGMYVSPKTHSLVLT